MLDYILSFVSALSVNSIYTTWMFWFSTFDDAIVYHFVLWSLDNKT